MELYSDITTRCIIATYTDTNGRPGRVTLDDGRVFSHIVDGERVEHFAAPLSWGAHEMLYAAGIEVDADLLVAF